MTLFQTVGHYLISHLTLSIFLCLAFGYLLGKIRIKSFTVGATVGTLVCGLLLSFIFASVGKFHIDGAIKNIFFSLFIFAIGYEVGPAFVHSFKKSGAKIIVFSIILSVIAFVVAWVLFTTLKIGPGEAAGILSGALTQSAILGTADSSMKALLSSSELATAQSNMAVAYALTYVFGTIGVIVFVRNFGPTLLGVKLVEATKQKIEATHYKEATGGEDIITALRARAFQVQDGSSLVGKSIQAIETSLSNTCLIEKITRQGQETPVAPDTTIQAGDVLTCIGVVEGMVQLEQESVTECSEAAYLQLPLQQVSVFLTKSFDKSILAQLPQFGIYITKHRRNGADLAPGTPAMVGDELVITGPKKAVAAHVAQLGYKKDTGSQTDVSYLSFGIVVGLLIGALTLTLSHIPISLGAGGGALFAGLYFGWYQNKHQNYGLIPSATRWFMKSVGLNLFICCVGLSAGSDFISALQSMGWKVFVIGAVVTIVPQIISLYVGKWILRMDAVDILGALTGAQTVTAALNGLVEETDSSIFAISYTPAYAVGNVLLTVMGPLMVALLH